MKITLPIVFSQWDSRWSNILLGFNTDQKFNIYNFGCLISCEAMAARYFGKDTDPGRINAALKEVKGFVTGGNYVYGSITKLYGDIAERVVQTPAALTDAQLNEIRGALDSGFVVMCQIDVNPKTVEADQHWVNIVGYNPSDENDFTIADPLGGKVRSMKDYLGWFRPSVRKTIEKYVLISGPKPQLTPEMIAIRKDSFNTFVHNDEQWHDTVHYLRPEADPNVTQFEEIQAVIAGIKSRATDLETQRNEALTKLAVSETEVSNRIEQVSRLEKQVLTVEKEKKYEIQAIIDSIPNVEKLKGQYQGRIVELEKSYDEAMKEIGKLKLKLAENPATPIEVPASQNILQSLVEWLRSHLKS